MNFLKKNIFLITIFLLAIFLRLNYDIFISGYNYDELAIVSIAKLNFPFEILKNCANLDYHAPLYYLLIHPMTLLNNEWVYLRLFNLFLSLINIYCFYKIGKLLINKKTGLLFALFLTVSHIQIMTVSLVKFYCLCFLLISFNFYYLIKILKHKKGYFKLGITNIFFILSSTLGFIFINLEYLILLITQKNKKEILKSYGISQIGFLLYLPILISQTKLAFSNIISPHSSYSEFSLFSLYNFLNDYISPLINYSCGIETYPAFSLFLNFSNSLKEGIFDHFSLIMILIFSLIPVVILLYYSVLNFKDNIGKILLISTMSYIITFIILTKLEITGFIPLYMYCAGLLLIILALYQMIKTKSKLSKILFYYLILVNLFISNYYPIEKRSFETIKLYNCFDEYFKENKIEKNKKILMISAGRFLEKYYKDREIIEFDHEKMEGKFQREILSLIYDKEKIKKATKEDIFEIIKPTIKNNIKKKDFENYFLQKVYDKLEKNEELLFVFHASTDPFLLKEEEILSHINNSKHSPHLTSVNIKNKEAVNQIDSDMVSEIILSYNTLYLIELLDKYLTRIKFEQYSPKNNLEYIKTYEDKTNYYSTKYLTQNAIKGWIFVTYKKQ